MNLMDVQDVAEDARSMGEYTKYEQRQAGGSGAVRMLVDNRSLDERRLALRDSN